MGGLRKYMPITYSPPGSARWRWSARRSSPASTPRTRSSRPSRRRRRAGATYAYWAVLLGVFVTAFYSFRLLYLTFHGRSASARPREGMTTHATATTTHDHGHGHGGRTSRTSRRGW
jgi:NADH-quinone oxidoreductase subunit L